MDHSSPGKVFLDKSLWCVIVLAFSESRGKEHRWASDCENTGQWRSLWAMVLNGPAVKLHALRHLIRLVSRGESSSCYSRWAGLGVTHLLRLIMHGLLRTELPKQVPQHSCIWIRSRAAKTLTGTNMGCQCCRRWHSLLQHDTGPLLLFQNLQSTY